VKDGVHQRRILELHTHTELVPEETLVTLDVAFPIGVLPFPITSVVLGHALGFTDTTLGRADPLDHGLVDPRVGDTEVSVVVGGVLDVFATKLRSNGDIGQNTHQTRPGAGIVGVEGRKGRIVRPIDAQTDTVDVVAEGVVTDNTVNTQGVLKLLVIEITDALPPSTRLLGILPELTEDTAIGNDNLKERTASGLAHVETISVIFTLEVDEDVIKGVQREESDVAKLRSGELNIDIAHVVAAFIRAFKRLNDEHLVILGNARDEALAVGDGNPVMSSTTDPLRTSELFMDVLGDVDVGSHDVIHLFLREEAIHEIGKLIPIGTHSLGEEAEAVAFRTRVSNRLKLEVVSVLEAATAFDLLPRLIGIVPTTTEAEGFLGREGVQGPSLGFETTVVDGVNRHLLDEEGIVVCPRLTEQGVHVLAGGECDAILGHNIVCFWFLDVNQKGSLPFGTRL